MKTKEVPVLLLTGYLGSGKTSLVNYILSNNQGIRFAVIVNDIGEVNIDADLIQKGGIVGAKDDSLVALQNGCICCTLKSNLMEQLVGILKTERFDYIIIEASGICEPEPIAQTICSMANMGGYYTQYGRLRLDAIVTVVDALRMQSEFACGDSLERKDIEEDDIENLIIQQVEFCNLILLNKASEVSSKELGRISTIIRTLQPQAEIIPCDYCKVSMEEFLHKRMFDYEQVATSATWIRAIEGPNPVEEVMAEGEAEEHENEYEHEHEHKHEHEHEHEHEHGHEHHHEQGEVEEYGISTYVYFRRPPFDMNKFDYFITKKWDKHIIRTKGVCYFSDKPDMTYLFEQAGVQMQLKEIGLWYAAAPADELEEIMNNEPGLKDDWDPVYGDRMQKLVFIGQHLDKEQLKKDLDAC